MKNTPKCFGTSLCNGLDVCKHCRLQEPCKLYSTEAVIPRKSVREFTVDMEKKLRDNDHKKHWREMSHTYLIARLRQETDELQKAIDNMSASDVQQEAADVANFAMMIWDNCRG